MYRAAPLAPQPVGTGCWELAALLSIQPGRTSTWGQASSLERGRHEKDVPHSRRGSGGQFCTQTPDTGGGGGHQEPADHGVSTGAGAEL